MADVHSRLKRQTTASMNDYEGLPVWPPADSPKSKSKSNKSKSRSPNTTSKSGRTTGNSHATSSVILPSPLPSPLIRTRKKSNSFHLHESSPSPSSHSRHNISVFAPSSDQLSDGASGSRRKGHSSMPGPIAPIQFSSSKKQSNKLASVSDAVANWNTVVASEGTISPSGNGAAMAARSIAARTKSSNSGSDDNGNSKRDKKSSSKRNGDRRKQAERESADEISGRSRAKTEKALLKSSTSGMVTRRTSGYESASDIDSIVAKLNQPASFHMYNKPIAPESRGSVTSVLSAMGSGGMSGSRSSGYFSETEHQDRPSSSSSTRRRRTTRFSRGTLIRGGAFAAFECLKNAESAEDILSAIQSLWTVCGVRSLTSCLSTVRKVIESVSNDNYINMRLFDMLQSYLDQPEYAKQPCKGKRVLIVGAGPVGLRLAIELCALGAEVHVVEQRKTFSRLNVLKLWHWVVQDVGVTLAGKIWDSGFGTGKKFVHVGTDRLQRVLTKTAVLLGVQVHLGHSFFGVGETYQPLVVPFLSPVTFTTDTASADTSNRSSNGGGGLFMDVVIDCGGARSTLLFERKFTETSRAIGVVGMFENTNSKKEKANREFSWARQFNQTLFDDLDQKGMELENCVYFNGEVHYFVSTPTKRCLLKQGVLKRDLRAGEPRAALVASDNVDSKALDKFLRKLVTFFNLPPSCDFVPGSNHSNLFDFSTLSRATEGATVVMSTTNDSGRKKQHSKPVFLALCGDSCMEPFWPEGLGVLRGNLLALDTAWAVASLDSDMGNSNAVLAERLKYYSLLRQLSQQTATTTLQPDVSSYTLDPNSRYQKLALGQAASVRPADVSLKVNSKRSGSGRGSRMSGAYARALKAEDKREEREKEKISRDLKDRDTSSSIRDRRGDGNRKDERKQRATSNASIDDETGARSRAKSTGQLRVKHRGGSRPRRRRHRRGGSMGSVASSMLLHVLKSSDECSGTSSDEVGSSESEPESDFDCNSSSSSSSSTHDSDSGSSFSSGGANDTTTDTDAIPSDAGGRRSRKGSKVHGRRDRSRARSHGKNQHGDKQRHQSRSQKASRRSGSKKSKRGSSTVRSRKKDNDVGRGSRSKSNKSRHRSSSKHKDETAERGTSSRGSQRSASVAGGRRRQRQRGSAQQNELHQHTRRRADTSSHSHRRRRAGSSRRRRHGGNSSD